MRKKITYEQLCKRLPLTSIEFLIDYSLDDAEDNLGALSPFIIDVDVDTTTALVKAEYSLKMDEESLRNCFHTCFYKDGAFTLDPQETKEVCSANFSKIFELVIYAINPKNKADVQIKTQKELADLFPFYPIPAERVLGEATEQNYNSLGNMSYIDFLQASGCYCTIPTAIEQYKENGIKPRTNTWTRAELY